MPKARFKTDWLRGDWRDRGRWLMERPGVRHRDEMAFQRCNVDDGVYLKPHVTYRLGATP